MDEVWAYYWIEFSGDDGATGIIHGAPYSSILYPVAKVLNASGYDPVIRGFEVIGTNYQYQSYLTFWHQFERDNAEEIQYGTRAWERLNG